MPNEVNSAKPENAEQQSAFQVLRIYAKDISFEIPNAPSVFMLNKDPEANVTINTKHTQADKNVYEVCLRVKVVLKVEDKVGFICELEQAGLFGIVGLNESAIEEALKQWCPGLLLPYARETIASLCVRGSFPPFHLAWPNEMPASDQAAASQNNT